MSETWNAYENAATGISLEYPVAWSYEEDLSIGGVIFAHDATISGQETNPFAPVVNILANRLPDVSIDDYTQQQVVRLRQMAVGNQSDLKIDRSASLAGYPAHRAICTLPVDPTRAIRLYSIWTKVNDWIYLVHFTCDIFEFSRHQRVVMRILNSMKIRVPSAKTALFSALFDKALDVAMRYPTAFQRVTPTTKSGVSPLLILRDKFQGPNREDFRRFISVVAHRRRKPAAEATLDAEVSAVIKQLESLLVAKVVLSWIQLGSVKARVLEYYSDAVENGSWYRQVVAVYEPNLRKPSPVVSPTSSSTIDTPQTESSSSTPSISTTTEEVAKSEEIMTQTELSDSCSSATDSTVQSSQTLVLASTESTPPPAEALVEEDVDYTVLLLTLQSTGPVDDEITCKLFDMTQKSTRFGADIHKGDSHPTWSVWEHLLLGFGLYYDPARYVCKDAGMPFAEAMFVHKDDVIDVPDDSTSFSIVVRQVPEGSTVNLTEIGNEIIENLGQVYTVEVLQTEDTKLNGRNCRLIVSRVRKLIKPGTTNSSGEHEQMYFAHKLVVNEDVGVAVWFAFAATPTKWKQEWANVDQYISSLYWLER